MDKLLRPVARLSFLGPARVGPPSIAAATRPALLPRPLNKQITHTFQAQFRAEFGSLSQRTSSSLNRQFPARTSSSLIRKTPFLASLAVCGKFNQLGSRIYATEAKNAPAAAGATTQKREPGRVLKFIYRSFAFCGFTVMVLGVGIVAFFVYDASTYKEENIATDVPVNQLALSPEKGGPKNLPIAHFLVDDEESEEAIEHKSKPHLVILGCGWGSVALLKNLYPGEYHVTVISPSNYFCFTPFLPSATVGTLELRSLVEPIRRVLTRLRGHFIQASAETVEFSDKLVELKQEVNGEIRHFYLPYDKLVIGVGSETNTHGVSGLENCVFLKTIGDAREIRKRVITNFERAVLPTTTDEERRKLLSFVICGGGPTGIEFAAELYDILNEDLARQYPKLLRNEVSVHVIQSRSHILNTYDEALSKYAEEKFAREGVDVLTHSRVKEVQKDKIIFSQKNEDGTVTTKEMPFGLCLWSTGVSQTQFAKNLAKKIDKQTNRHALETDTHLRLIGAPLGDVYAIGDCSTVQNNVAENIIPFLRDIAWERGKDPETVHLTFKDWQNVAARVKKRFPQANQHLRRLDKLFHQYDADKSGTLDFGELKQLLLKIDDNLTSLPATAQRANQQGVYLAKKFNRLSKVGPTLAANGLLDGDLDEAYYNAFEYKHLGSLAYVGNAAIFDINGLSMSGGIAAVYLWRSAYFAQSVSLRTRFLLAMDWAKRALFGRDMMTF